MRNNLSIILILPIIIYTGVYLFIQTSCEHIAQDGLMSQVFFF